MVTRLHGSHRLSDRGEGGDAEIAQKQCEPIEFRRVGDRDALRLVGDDPPRRRDDRGPRHEIRAVGVDRAESLVRDPAFPGEHRNPEAPQSDEAGDDVRDDDDVEHQSHRVSPPVVAANRVSSSARVSSHHATLAPIE